MVIYQIIKRPITSLAIAGGIGLAGYLGYRKLKNIGGGNFVEGVSDVINEGFENVSNTVKTKMIKEGKAFKESFLENPIQTLYDSKKNPLIPDFIPTIGNLPIVQKGAKVADKVIITNISNASNTISTIKKQGLVKGITSSTKQTKFYQNLSKLRKRRNQ